MPCSTPRSKYAKRLPNCRRAAGGVAGQGVQGAMNKTQGVELEIRKDDGNTIMVVQKQGATKFSAGQRVVMANNGSQVTVSPR